MIDRGKALVAGVDVELDSALPDDRDPKASHYSIFSFAIFAYTP